MTATAPPRNVQCKEMDRAGGWNVPHMTPADSETQGHTYVRALKPSPRWPALRRTRSQETWFWSCLASSSLVTLGRVLSGKMRGLALFLLAPHAHLF